MKRVVLGVDSGTQSVKVVAVDVETGRGVSEGRAAHHGDTIQDPEMWWHALVEAVRAAIKTAGPNVEVAALSVGGQQHGLVALDHAGSPVQHAPLWNNTDAAPDADRLNADADFATAVGSRLVASFTIAKVAHLARTAPDLMARVATICLPHDYLNYRLTGKVATDRGDASGSGWWSPSQGAHRRDLLALAVGDHLAERLTLPEVSGSSDPAGILQEVAATELGLPIGIPIGPGSGDNMAAALGIGAAMGEYVVSLGTSGTAFTVSDHGTHDPTGEVCGFADATGHFLPLACMLNCTRVVDSVAALVGLDREAALAAPDSTPPGAGGLLLIPYFGGERTPNQPGASGQILGITGNNLTPNTLVRAAVDGVAAGVAYMVAALGRVGLQAPSLTLVGGGAAHPVWQQAIADATGLAVSVRGETEHAARGMAMQAAAIVLGAPIQELVTQWRPPVVTEISPRPDARAAFQLEHRQTLLAAL